jgi:hypothetical protein
VLFDEEGGRASERRSESRESSGRTIGSIALIVRKKIPYC